MDDQDSLLESLTEIEEQVLELLERGGIGVQEIATTLDIAPDEVRTCVQNSLTKLSRLTPGGRPLPPAASMALAIPVPHDIPKHVGQVVPRKGPRQRESQDAREHGDRSARLSV